MARARSQDEMKAITAASGMMANFWSRFASQYFLYGGSGSFLYAVANQTPDDGGLTSELAGRMGRKLANLSNLGVELVPDGSHRRSGLGERQPRPDGLVYTHILGEVPYREGERYFLEYCPQNWQSKVVVRSVAESVVMWGQGINEFVLLSFENKVILGQLPYYDKPILLPGTTWRCRQGRTYTPYFQPAPLPPLLTPEAKGWIDFIDNDSILPPNFDLLRLFK